MMRCWPILFVCAHCFHVALAVPVEHCPVDGTLAKNCADSRVDALSKWSKQRGIHAPSVQTGHANGMRGLIATKPIKKSGLLLSVPRKAALIVHDGDPSPFPHLVDDEEWAELPQLLQTNFILLWHAKQGAQSPFHPWIQSLPTSYDTLVHWTPSQLDELQLGSTPTEKQFRAQVESAARDLPLLHAHYQQITFYRQLNVSLEDQNWGLDCIHSRSVSVPQLIKWTQPLITALLLIGGGCVFGLSPLKKSPNSKPMLWLTLSAAVLTLGPWVWQFALNGAAQPGGQSDTALLPLFDLLNHDSRHEGPWMTSSWTGSHIHIIAAAHVFDAGQEVLISYGKKTSESFLLNYGFVDTSYQFDAYSTDLLEHVQQRYVVPLQRIYTLQSSKRLFRALQSMSLKKGGADEDVLRALRYLLASEQELREVEEQAQSLGQWLSDILEYRQRPTALTPFQYRTLSDATEQAIHEVMHNFCKSVLDSKPTTLKADQADLTDLSRQQQGDEQHRRKLLALHFRIGKKKILQSCVRKHQRLANQYISR